jgi:N-acetylneuraminic acid mutarotase
MKTTAILFIFISGLQGIVFGATSPYAKTPVNGPAARDGAIMFAIGPKFYFGAGSYKDFWVYNSDSNTTRRLKDIPGVKTNRSFCTGFAMNNKGYVGLGFDSTGILKNDLWQYDPATNIWTKKADFPGDARDGAGVFVIGNKAYICGGSNEVIVYSDFYAYDGLANKWTQKNDLPSPIIFPACFSLGNKGYMTTGAMGLTETNTTYQYDTAKDTWAQKADYKGGLRQTCIAFTLGNYAYVGLGQTNYTTALNDMYRYDPTNDIWAKINDFTGGTRGWSSAASNGTKAIFGFGWDLGSKFYNDLWSIDMTNISGIETTETSEGFQAYPNPAHNVLNIMLPENNLGTTTINITDMQGRVVQMIRPEPGITRIQIKLDGLAKGMYFINTIANSTVITKKIDIE